jgi:hypothetical protein
MEKRRKRREKKRMRGKIENKEEELGRK